MKADLQRGGTMNAQRRVVRPSWSVLGALRALLFAAMLKACFHRNSDRIMAAFAGLSGSSSPDGVSGKLRHVQVCAPCLGIRCHTAGELLNAISLRAENKLAQSGPPL
jgi:hypothetical protein